MKYMKNIKWSIYLLHDRNGHPDYVGSSVDMKRRLKEHKTKLKYKPIVIILETGSGDGRLRSETKWIEKLLSDGIPLRNKIISSGGRMKATPELLQRLSRVKLGKKQPPGTGQRIAATTRGKPHDWSDEGWENAARTQFKPGHKTTAEQQERISISSRMTWQAIPPDQRSAMATERNKKAWANRSAARRSEIGQKIAQSRATNLSPDRLSEIASHNAKAAFKDPNARTRCSSQVKNWWASLTPEARAEYLTRRTEKIVAAKALKRAFQELLGASEQ